MKIAAKKIAAQCAVAAVLAGVGLATASAPHADAATVPHFNKCADLNKTYPHGVRKASSTKDKVVSRTTKTITYKVSRATVNAKVYAANATKLDADKDGIACER